jgi:hypothetical protein
MGRESKSLPLAARCGAQVGGGERERERERERDESATKRNTYCIVSFETVSRLQVISRVALLQPARPTSVERGWSSIRAVVTTDDNQQRQVNPCTRVSVPYTTLPRG